jgi:hypothetical protein
LAGLKGFEGFLGFAGLVSLFDSLYGVGIDGQCVGGYVAVWGGGSSTPN